MQLLYYSADSQAFSSTFLREIRVPHVLAAQVHGFSWQYYKD